MVDDQRAFVRRRVRHPLLDALWVREQQMGSATRSPSQPADEFAGARFTRGTKANAADATDVAQERPCSIH